jgi:hypothetical protein
LLKGPVDGRGILQVAFDEADTVEQVADVVHPAPPPVEAIDFYVRVMTEDVLGQMTACKSRDPRDEYTHSRILAANYRGQDLGRWPEA